MKRSSEKAIVEKASTLTVERIVRDLADTHISVGKALVDLREKLTVEAANLSEIQQAIALESARLKEIHDIDAAAVSLKALLEVQSERLMVLTAFWICSNRCSRASDVGRHSAAWRSRNRRGSAGDPVVWLEFALVSPCCPITSTKPLRARNHPLLGSDSRFHHLQESHE